MKDFRAMVVTDVENEEWQKEDLIELLDELDSEDLAYITNEVLDIIAYNSDYDWEEMEDTEWGSFEDNEEIAERMTSVAKKKAALKRRKPAFKKAMRLKKKCMSKYGDKVRKSKGKANAFVCGTDGKLHKGMSRKDRRLLAKTRKRNKNKIIK